MEYLKNILIESTTQAKLCEHHVLVSIDEIEKVDKASIREVTQTQVTSTTPPQFTLIQPTLPIVVIKEKRYQ